MKQLERARTLGAPTTVSTLAVVLLVAVTSAGCGPGELFRAEDPVARVTVEPGEVVVLVGEGYPVRAVPLTAAGQSLAGGTGVVWETANPLIATVEPDPMSASSAVVTGRQVGSTLIRVTLEELEFELPVQVTDVPGCSERVALIRELSVASGAYDLCMSSTSDVYNGLINHSSFDQIAIPDQPQANDETDIFMIGGRFLDKGLDDILERFPRSPPTAARASVTRSTSTEGYVRTEGYLRVGSAIDPPDGPFLLVWAAMRQPIPEVPGEYLEYAVVFDQDRDPSNNFVPLPQFSDDWALGSDLLYKVGYTFQPDEWTMQAFDISNTSGVPAPPVPFQVRAQVLFQEQTVVFLIPWTGGDPLARWTVFSHQGNFGFGEPWRGDYHPSTDAPLFDFYSGYMP